MNLAKHVQRQRDRIIKELLPDICMIYPKRGSSTTITGTGIQNTVAAAPRIWRGSDQIPCRIDLSRAFRPEKLRAQATEVDEFNLELPYDMVIDSTDIIKVTNPNTAEIERFEIRKKKDLSSFDGTIECTIAALGVDLDA